MTTPHRTHPEFVAGVCHVLERQEQSPPPPSNAGLAQAILSHARAATRPEGGGDTPSTSEATQHTPNAALEGASEIIQLNPGWRVRDDGALQWHLERQGSSLGKPEKWIGRRYHVERDPLLRSIRDLCGEVDRAAITKVNNLPAYYYEDKKKINVRST